MLKKIGKFIGPEIRIDRNDSCSDSIQREKMQKMIDTDVQLDGYTVAMAIAGISVSRCQFLHPPERLAVSHIGPVAHIVKEDLFA